MYYNFSENISKIPSHRLLAINRGEKEGALKIKFEVDEEKIYDFLESKIILSDTIFKEEIVETCLTNVGLWNEVKDALFKKGTFLSGGQQQRLCIARALALKPEVLLMDEPTSALDPIATNRIEELLLELKKEFTIIIVTHNMSQAARISDYSMFMYLGELIEYDKTRIMFTNPRDKRTEEYLTGQFG